MEENIGYAVFRMEKEEILERDVAQMKKKNAREEK
jgi:hypothetical protein